MNGVAIVAINHFGSVDVARLLKSLRASSFSNWRLILVDNSMDPSEAALLRSVTACEPRAVVLESPTNLGYFGGARYALASGDVQGRDWVVVCNTDLTFSPDALSRLTERGATGVVAPSITSGATGAEQNPYLRSRPGRWTVRRWRWEFAFVPLGRLVVAGHHLLRRAAPTSPREAAERQTIYAPHGACIAFSREFFDRGGSLAHPPFLFAEEITVGEECRRIGVSVVFEPQIRLVHNEHAATGVWRTRQMLAWQRESIRHIATLLERETTSERS